MKIMLIFINSKSKPKLWEHSHKLKRPLVPIYVSGQSGFGDIMAKLIDGDDNPIIYDSTLVTPDKLCIFGSTLALRIVKELAKEPSCAMDLSRKLEEHEQKIYYHLRNLEGSGIVKQTRTEQRYGMIAKIYEVVTPVVSTKLYDGGYPMEKGIMTKNPRMASFLRPFIKEGKFNALVVIGDSYAHGRFDGNSTEGAHVFDLALMLGSFMDSTGFPNYKLDTEIKDSDLKKNLILIGNPRTNMIVDKINSSLPVYFDEKNNFVMVSKESGKTYDGGRDAVVMKIKNPFRKDKKILVFGGRTRERGIRSAIKGFIKYANELSADNRKDKDMVLIVRGMDKDGDKIIDDAEILERW